MIDELGATVGDDLDLMSEWSPELTVMDWAIVKQALVAKAADGNLKAIELIFRMAKSPAYQAACEGANQHRRDVAERAEHTETAPATAPARIDSPDSSPTRAVRSATRNGGSKSIPSRTAPPHPVPMPVPALAGIAEP